MAFRHHAEVVPSSNLAVLGPGGTITDCGRADLCFSPHSRGLRAASPGVARTLKSPRVLHKRAVMLKEGFRGLELVTSLGQLRPIQFRLSLQSQRPCQSRVLSQARRLAAQGRRVARQTSSRTLTMTCDACDTINRGEERQYFPKVGHRPGGVLATFLVSMRPTFQSL